MTKQITWQDFQGKKVMVVHCGDECEVVLHHVEDAGVIVEDEDGRVRFIPWDKIYSIYYDL